VRYKILGKTGLRVSEFCLGTMTFGQEWGDFLKGASREDSKKIFDLYVDSGGNFIDTANIYQNGSSEKYVGELIASDREKFDLSTKYTLTKNPSDPNAGGSNRKTLYQSVEASLRRLNTTYIDLLWVHVWDYMTPLEELMRSLDDMIRSGKILYVGISDAPAWIVARANTMSELQGWSPFISLQIMYNLIERTPERELLPMARDLDIGVTAWSPLAGGVLSGKYNKEKVNEQKRFDKDNPMTSLFVNNRSLSIANVVQTIAEELKRTPSEVALSWLKYQGERGVIIPIIGARTQEQLKNNLASLDLKLSGDQLKRLDDISKIEMGFPHDFLSADMLKTMMYGNTYSSTDYHRKVPYRP
jgi:aryl-alcohol dehydrogenase-like predicted oxidoreductase